MLGKQIAMQERQFNGVSNGLNLRIQPSDVVIRDIWNLFEQQMLNLGLGQTLEQQAATHIEAQQVTSAQVRPAQGVS